MKRLHSALLYCVVSLALPVSQTLADAYVLITAHGGVADGRVVSDATMGPSTTTLTSATAGFVASDAGRRIVVAGAGASGDPLMTTIAAVTNATTVTLDQASVGAVSGVRAIWGSDNSQAILDALAAADTVAIPAGVFASQGLVFKEIHNGKRLVLLEGAHLVMLDDPQDAEQDFLSISGDVDPIADFDLVVRSGASLQRVGNYATGEGRHIVALGRAQRINVFNEGTISHSGGDGIYSKMSALINNEIFPRDIYIRVGHVRQHRRNGISIITGDEFLIEDGLIEDIQQIAPSNAIDLEPNQGQHLGKIHIRNILARNVDGSAYAVFLAKAATTKPTQVICENCSAERAFRLLRVARLPDRTAGNEVVVSFSGRAQTIRAQGSSVDPTVDPAGVAVHDIGQGNWITIQAEITDFSAGAHLLEWQRRTSMFAPATGAADTNISIVGVGSFDKILSVPHVDTAAVSSRLVRADMDIGSATFADFGGNANFVGDVGLSEPSPFTANYTGNQTLTPDITRQGLRRVTNVGVTSDIKTLTLDNAQYAQGAIVRIDADGADLGTIVRLSDTSKIIRPFKSYQIGATAPGSHIVLKRDSAGDWDVEEAGGNWGLFGIATGKVIDPAAGQSQAELVTVPGAFRGGKFICAHTRDMGGLVITGVGTENVNEVRCNFFRPSDATAPSTLSGTVRVWGQPGA